MREKRFSPGFWGTTAVNKTLQRFSDLLKPVQPICRGLLGALLLTCGATVATADEAGFQSRMSQWQARPTISDNPQSFAMEMPASQTRQAIAYQVDGPPNAGRMVQPVGYEFASDAPPAAMDGNYFGEDFCGTGACCPSPRWWARKELLVWWHKGRDMPPLVTMDSNTQTNTNDGRLPAAPILFGGGQQAADGTLGGRIDIGTWLDPCQRIGIGGKFFALSEEQLDYTANSAQLQTDQLIAVPFTRVGTGADSFIVASNGGPQTINGSVAIHASSEVFGAEAYTRLLLKSDGYSRVDFVTGYQFGRVNDGLVMTTVQTSPTAFTLQDSYRTYNQFHGGILGLQFENQISDCWSLSGFAKIGLGGMDQRVVINGSDTRTTNASGLLVEQGESGTFTRTVFATSPEFNLTLNRRITHNMEFLVGYNMLFYTNVARAQQQISTVLDEVNTPFVIKDTTLWLQGINLGLVIRH